MNCGIEHGGEKLDLRNVFALQHIRKEGVLWQSGIR